MEPTKRTVHCEVYGTVTSLDKTRVLTKISGIINLKMLDNPRVDNNLKVIHSDGKLPMKFYTKIQTPEKLKGLIGELYATVDDEDEIEQSTHILSDEGLDNFMGRPLIGLIPYLEEHWFIKFPDTMFFVSANDTSKFKMQTQTCNNWGVTYPSIGKKYMVKRILDAKTESETFGTNTALWPPFNLGVSDCAIRNQNGTAYLFRVDEKFVAIKICSNESAVEFCDKNNLIAYYNDFINEGKLRVLTKYTEVINTNLQNPYKFRSSKI